MKRIRKATRLKIDHTYQVVESYIRERGYAPSFRDIGELAEIASTESVRKYLRILSAEGKLRYECSTPRSITLASST